MVAPRSRAVDGVVDMQMDEAVAVFENELSVLASRAVIVTDIVSQREHF